MSVVYKCDVCGRQCGTREAWLHRCEIYVSAEKGNDFQEPVHVCHSCVEKVTPPGSDLWKTARNLIVAAFRNSVV